MTTAMPGQVPSVLAAALEGHDTDTQEALVAHVLGGTSADFLSDWFRRAGTPVGATTIKTFRRSIA